MKAAWSRLRAAAGSLEACAVAASLALAAAFYLPRLPASLDGLLPRRAGFSLFARLVAAGQTRQGRAAAMAAAYLALLLAAVSLARRARAAWRRFKPQLTAAGRGERLARAVCALAGFYLLLRAARFGLAAALDLLQNAFYPPESLSLAEPLWTWLAFLVFTAAFLRAAAALLEWTLSGGPLALELAREWAGWTAALVAPGLALYLWGAAAYDAGKPSLAAAAALPPPPAGVRRLAILTEAEGKPSQEPFTLALGVPGQSDYSQQRLDAAERFLSRGRSVYARAARRFLYSGRAFAMDAPGLRRALSAGAAAGDPLARTLLLEHLGCASDSPETRAALDALADESRWRAGALAAERLSSAYARLGDAEAAARWRLRLKSLPGSPAPGLLPEPAASAPRGEISGRVTGLPGGRVALYCRLSEFAPYALGPGQLVDSAPLDAAGRFRFLRLPEGGYFLAVSRDEPGETGRDLSLLGHRGDIVLTRRKPAARVELRARP